MIGRVPRHRSVADDVDPWQLHVFIPGALASGLLVSVGLMVGDLIRRLRGDHGIRRMVEMTAAAAAAEIRDGLDAPRHVRSGLRAPAVYGVAASASLGIAIAVVPGATWNFFNPRGYISGLAWIWALSLLGAIVFVALGVQMLRLAPLWTPVFVALTGIGLTLRIAWAAGAAASILGTGIAVTVVVTEVSRRLGRGTAGVPAGVRPLLARSPLGRWDRVSPPAAIRR